MQTTGSTNKKYYATIYKMPTHDKQKATYGAYVIAVDECSAREILTLRGNNEILHSTGLKINKTRLYTKPSLSYKRRNLPETLHSLSFIGNMAINACLIKPSDLLSDTGLIHEIIHELHFPEEFGYRIHVYKELRRFDQITETLGF